MEYFSLYISNPRQSENKKARFFLRREVTKMIEVTVKVNYKGQNYQTNVIANKKMNFDKIKLLAEEQVAKQWNM